MGSSEKMVGFPNNHGVFLLKMIILGCEMGVPPFKEIPKSWDKVPFPQLVDAGLLSINSILPIQIRSLSRAVSSHFNSSGARDIMQWTPGRVKKD